ncbi:coiled-coil domain-containing protein [Curtanaerobium respiraculi]|uniref:coiled-coil domain-containing protein n=1 Tax=Curtanaerobium respiraculi TaxID=2949669 RepID=UPI0024B38807|nr:hypothetical protein [Curtanaerobium respiraculi]
MFSEESTEIRIRARGFALGFALAACALAWVAASPCPASALSVEEAQASLDDAEAKMQSAVDAYDAANAEYERMQMQIDSTAQQAAQAQELVVQGRESLARTAAARYRSGDFSLLLAMIVESDSVEDLVQSLDYCQYLMQFYSDQVEDQKRRSEEFRALLAELDAQRDAQQQKLRELQAAQAEAQAIVDQASAALSDAQAEEAARLAALEALNASIGSSMQGVVTVEDIEAGEANATGWYTGIASAYGGSTDPSTPNPGTTATGALCTDGTMGVAVPMSWPNYRSFFGKLVEIRYGGQTVIAVVNDCGSMGGGLRSLDLQPGVFGAFGYSSCDHWGLRTVSYRFL